MKQQLEILLNRYVWSQVQQTSICSDSSSVLFRNRSRTNGRYMPVRINLWCFPLLSFFYFSGMVCVLACMKKNVFSGKFSWILKFSFPLVLHGALLLHILLLPFTIDFPLPSIYIKANQEDPREWTAWLIFGIFFQSWNG